MSSVAGNLKVKGRIMQKKFSSWSRAALLSSLLFVPTLAHAQTTTAPAANAPVAIAQPLELRQKWVAGQQLDYDVALNGTVNMQASPNIPSMFAGLPLDIDVDLKGQSTLDTLAVDAQGTGTVAMKLNRLLLNAESFGQKAVFSVEDNKATFTMNGQRFGGAGRDASAFTNPNTALQLTSRARLTGVVPVPGADNNAQRPATAMPFDPASFADSVFWRVIPSLWPETPVKTGDTWSTPVAFPKEALKGETTPVTDLTLGKFDFTLRGEETVSGRKALRIEVDGSFSIDEKAATLIQGESKAGPPVAAPAAGANGTRNPRIQQKLSRATQKVSGEVWFDAVAGQIVRIELNLDTQAASRDVLPPGFKGKRMSKQNPTDPDSWLDFAGTLQMQLKNVSTKVAAAQ